MNLARANKDCDSDDGSSSGSGSSSSSISSSSSSDDSDDDGSGGSDSDSGSSSSDSDSCRSGLTGSGDAGAPNGGDADVVSCVVCGDGCASTATAATKKRVRPRTLPMEFRLQLSALYAFLSPGNVSRMSSSDPALPPDEADALQRGAQRLASYLPIGGCLDDQIEFCCRLKLDAWRMGHHLLLVAPPPATSAPGASLAATEEEDAAPDYKTPSPVLRRKKAKHH